MNSLVLISLPLISGLIGWLTNWVAIKMLFYPKRPLKIFRWKIQGLIPRRQKDVAKRAGDIIEREVLSRHLIRHEIGKIDVTQYVDDIAIRLVWERIGPRLKRFPVLGNLVGDSVLYNLTKVAINEMHREIGPLKEKLAAAAENHLDIKRLVEERIAGFDLDKLEEVVLSVGAREFKAIELAGGVLGFFVGLIQLLILWLSGNLA